MSPSPILWILAALIGINTEKLTVIQNVPRIQADEGQTVSLPCTYTANVSKLIGTYSWYKNGRKGIEVSNETAEYRGRIYSHKEDFIHTADASIQIKDVRLNDAGVYYCKVRMMQLGEEYGAGTNLTVREKTESINGLLLTLVISAPVTGGVLLIVALRCVQLRRKKAIKTFDHHAGPGPLRMFNRYKYKKQIYQKSITWRTHYIEKLVEGSSCWVGNQANEVDYVQYSALNFNERERKPRSSIDKDKIECGFAELQL
ncbi:uncharacterized protein [Heterodontus francisci]|uniref:uncharacterized protein n=1 Tax=Heterodontus francisci TaxID=7792 RepID=UPI00355B4148